MLHVIKANPYHDAFGRFSSADDAAAVQEGSSVTMTQIGGAKGSNPGGLFQDADGVKHYVKFYANPQQARTEETASRIFESIGARTPRPVVATVNGKEALVTKWNDNLERLKPAEFESLTGKQQEQAAKMFAAAVLTKNWDVVGLAHDNIVRDKDTGNLVEIDTGGSFEFRAQGEHKDFGEDVAEHATLQDKQYPAGHVFATVFNQNPAALDKAYQVVKNLDMKSIRTIFETSGLKNQEDLYHAFKRRRRALLAKGGLEA